MMSQRSIALGLSLLFACNAWAQVLDTPDPAQLPDASVGEGGADRTGEESQDSTASECAFDRDCDRGTACVGGRCVFRAARAASTSPGCGAVPSGAVLSALAALLVALAVRARRGR
jgi:hypothetical protein